RSRPVQAGLAGPPPGKRYPTRVGLGCRLRIVTAEPHIPQVRNRHRPRPQHGIKHRPAPDTPPHPAQEPIPADPRPVPRYDSQLHNQHTKRTCGRHAGHPARPKFPLSQPAEGPVLPATRQNMPAQQPSVVMYIGVSYLTKGQLTARIAVMYVTRVPNRGSPPAVLLRESYREGGKVKNRTLANLSSWP